VKEKLALLRNIAWAGMAGYVEAAIGLAVGIIIARTLGPSQYGNYAFAIWLCGILLMASNHALPSSAMKFLAEARGANRPDVAAALVHRFMRLHVVSSCVVLGLFTVWMLVKPIVDWQQDLPALLGISIVAVWARAAFWMRSGIAKGYESLLPPSVALGATAFLNLAVIGLLAWKGASIVHFFMAYAALGVVSNLIIAALSPRFGIEAQAGPIPDEMRLRLRGHLLTTGVLMLIGIGTAKTIEMSLLKAYAAPEVVGYFAIAGSLTKGAIDVLIGGLSAVLLPAMARRFGTGSSESLGRMFSESTRFYCFVGLAVAGLGASVAGEIVQVLYGPRFDGAIAAVSWHLIIAGLTLVSAPALALLTATDRQADRVRIVVYSLVLNLVVGAILVPRYELNGAIASFGITVTYQTILSLRYAWRSAECRLSWGALVRLGIAAMIATAASHGVMSLSDPDIAFLTGAVTFLVIYLPATVVLRTWRSADIDLIAMIVGRMGSIGSRLSSSIGSLRRFAMAD
jgi:O-antigen/teichoic acid export membrane protein